MPLFPYVHLTELIVNRALCIVNCALCIMHYALCIVHCAFYKVVK